MKSLIPGLSTSVRGAGLCLLVTLAVSGCKDASSDPLAVVLPDGDMAGLLEGGLPSLGSLATEAELQPALERPLELWSDSWDRPAPEGRELRYQAYQQAAPPLAEALGRASVERMLGRIEEGLAVAAGLDREALGNRILEQVALAEGARDAARRSLLDGDVEEALLHTMVASDLLREVGPESVIRVMIREAEVRVAGLAADRGDGDRPGSNDLAGSAPVSDQDLERGERLVRGARLALESGDWVRAAQRAYYACQLLGIQPN